MRRLGISCPTSYASTGVDWANGRPLFLTAVPAAFSSPEPGGVQIAW